MLYIILKKVQLNIIYNLINYYLFPFKNLYVLTLFSDVLYSSNKKCNYI